MWVENSEGPTTVYNWIIDVGRWQIGGWWGKRFLLAHPHLKTQMCSSKRHLGCGRYGHIVLAHTMFGPQMNFRGGKKACGEQVGQAGSRVTAVYGENRIHQPESFSINVPAIINRNTRARLGVRIRLNEYTRMSLVNMAEKRDEHYLAPCGWKRRDDHELDRIANPVFKITCRMVWWWVCSLLVACVADADFNYEYRLIFARERSEGFARLDWNESIEYECAVFTAIRIILVFKPKCFSNW